MPNETLTKEEPFTVNTARDILNEMGLTSIGNGNFIRKNIPTEKVVWAMVNYSNKASASQITLIREQLLDLRKCSDMDKNQIQGKIDLIIESLK